jgi:hypothetical protein
LEVRRRTGLNGFSDLRFVSRSREGDAWRIRFAAEISGEEHEVEVDARAWGEQVFLTCRSPVAKSPRRFLARAEAPVASPALEQGSPSAP